MKLGGQSGLTLIEILILAAILALLTLTVFPKYIQSQHSARANICVNNLRLITQAVAQYQIDEGIADGAEIDLYKSGIMSSTDPSAYIQRDLTCPETGRRYPNVKTGAKAVCPDEAKFTDHVYKTEK